MLHAVNGAVPSHPDGLTVVTSASYALGCTWQEGRRAIFRTHSYHQQDPYDYQPIFLKAEARFHFVQISVLSSSDKTSHRSTKSSCEAQIGQTKGKEKKAPQLSV